MSRCARDDGNAISGNFRYLMYALRKKNSQDLNTTGGAFRGYYLLYLPPSCPLTVILNAAHCEKMVVSLLLT